MANAYKFDSIFYSGVSKIEVQCGKIMTARSEGVHLLRNNVLMKQKSDTRNDIE